MVAPGERRGGEGQRRYLDVGRGTRRELGILHRGNSVSRQKGSCACDEGRLGVSFPTTQEEELGIPILEVEV